MTLDSLGRLIKLSSPVGRVRQPEITDAAQDNGEEEHGSKEDDHDEWARFAESANPGSTPNLEAYLDAKSKKENSKEQFSATLEECVVGLNQTMIHEMLQDSVVSLHEDFGKRFEAYETDIIATMKSNHNRRTALLKAMDEANRTWNVQYKNIRATILAEETTAVRLLIMRRCAHRRCFHLPPKRTCYLL